jgi:hypothetical protein
MPLGESVGALHKKKNWLFIGDADAGQRGAIVYTIVESCRRRDLDPYTYLRDVLTRLPRVSNRQIPEVTPEACPGCAKTLTSKATSNTLCERFMPEFLHGIAPNLGYGVMDSLKNCCCIEETLLVAQTSVPVARTELPAGSHKPEVRFVQY